MRRFLICLVASVGVPTSLFGQTVARDSRPFADVAARSFDAWDADRNGTLSPSEIDALVVNPSYKGEQAAALAAMKLVIRSNKITPPELTRDFVQNHSKDPAGEALPSEVQARDKDEKKTVTARPPSSLERRYQSALRRIKSAKPDLFADGTPDIDHCHQGPLGDCFLVAGIGAMVQRDPQSVKKLIVEQQDARGDLSYSVSFPDGQSVTISALTDAEFGLTSTTGGDGLWLAVLEKAVGSLRNKSKPEAKQTLSASDAISRGGSLGSTLRLFTGHSIDRVTMRSRAAKGQADAVIEQARTLLATTVKASRLAGASTGTTTPLPPGINGKHAYAILGFDETAGIITLWNPHGNTFKPKGEPGLESGYPTKGGIFRVPVADFVRIFDSMVCETDNPAAKPSPRT